MFVEYIVLNCQGRRGDAVLCDTLFLGKGDSEKKEILRKKRFCEKRDSEKEEILRKKIF